MKSRKMSVLSHILTSKNQHHPLLALLLDPDKKIDYTSLLSNLNEVDLIFVGGSTGSSTETCVTTIRPYTIKPIVLFPGNIAQFTPLADALLFLTLLNARTSEVLIEPHLQVAQQVLHSGIESIPMGYILIDGARKSSVEIATRCKPIPQDDVDTIVSTAIAGQLLGKQLIYLEAGSGALSSVAPEIIREVSSQVQLPLIVGGGICSPDAMLRAFDAGADIVVIGNYFEQNPDEIGTFARIKREKYGE